MIIESIRKLIPENVVIGESILFIMDWMAASISEISLLNSSMSLMVCLSSNLKTYLLNNFMIFNIGEHSNCLISSVKPLNVDEDVVDIDYESDAGWYIWFKSNYYDHVVFEITAENGNKYYIRIDRVTFGIADTFGQNQNKPQVVANFYYPSDYSYLFDKGFSDTCKIKPFDKCNDKTWFNDINGTDDTWSISPLYSSYNPLKSVSVINGEFYYFGSAQAFCEFDANPTFYLNANVLVISGDGSADNPYIIK